MSHVIGYTVDDEIYSLVRARIIDDATMSAATVAVLEDAICKAIAVTHENGTPEGSAEAVIDTLRFAFRDGAEAIGWECQ